MVYFEKKQSIIREILMNNVKMEVKMTRRHIVYTIITALALSAIIVIVSLAYSIKGQRAEAHRRSLENSVAETRRRWALC